MVLAGDVKKLYGMISMLLFIKLSSFRLPKVFNSSGNSVIPLDERLSMVN